MRILLLSMPDSFEHTPSLTMRMPNAALTSLAGNVDAHHQVAVADLICAQHDVAGTVRRLLEAHRPDLVGLSVMTFQRRTALRVAAFVRERQPGAWIVAGGYDPSLAPEAYENGSSCVDFLVRGEGELTFSALLRALESGAEPAGIAGLSYRLGAAFVRNPPRPVSHLRGEIRTPNRSARVLNAYTFLGRPIDIVETSRGCTYDCSFCSIVEMRGRNFETWPLDRVIADIRDARARGARTIFLVDDNITLNVKRFAALCEAIIAARLQSVDYIVQAMTSSIASDGETLAPLMRRAGFRYVFLGIENVVDGDLQFLKAGAKNTLRSGGRPAGNASARACDLIRRHGMFVVGGLIVGNPDDTPEAIDANLAFARRHVDWPYIQHPTPYPGTPMTHAFRAAGLIVNENLHEYDGTTAVVKTRHLSAEDVEFLRWRAERWMKSRHFPRVLLHDPVFVLRRARRMFAHTFRGCGWRTFVGLEDERRAFERFRAIRRRERDYLGEGLPEVPATVSRWRSIQYGQGTSSHAASAP
ncbi:MAG TPA: radical SAM protein [Gemmatimonadaceae bacterium]|nr:radical SAM protein [Gemmatimonadaceae bacterium]